MRIILHCNNCTIVSVCTSDKVVGKKVSAFASILAALIHVQNVEIPFPFTLV